jgi:hypothetical protein
MNSVQLGSTGDVRPLVMQAARSALDTAEVRALAGRRFAREAR